MFVKRKENIPAGFQKHPPYGQQGWRPSQSTCHTRIISPCHKNLTHQDLLTMSQNSLSITFTTSPQQSPNVTRTWSEHSQNCLCSRGRCSSGQDLRLPNLRGKVLPCRQFDKFSQILPGKFHKNYLLVIFPGFRMTQDRSMSKNF